jgi:hypothetical protein
MRYRRQFSGRVGVAGLAAVMAGALVLGACGSSAPASAPPKQAVNQAFRALGSQSGLDLHISLGVTAAQLQQMARADGGSSALTPHVADDIASSSIVIDYNTGNGKAINNTAAATDHAQQFGLAVQVGTSDPIQLRYLDQTIYLRADVATLLRDLGQDPSKAAGFGQAVQGANQYVPGIAALGQGNWVSVPVSALTGLLKGLPAAGSSAATPASPAVSKQMLSQLHQAFTSNATYTDLGTKSGRTEYQASLAVRPFVQQALSAVGSSLGSLSNVPGASSITGSINSSINKIPANQKLLVDVWVSHNKVQEIDIDLNQFSHKFAFAVPVRILIGPGAPVTAPAGATPLNLSKLGGLLGGMLGGASSST